MFNLPKHGLSYTSGIQARSLALIDRKIWHGMDSINLKRWMRNFTSDEEKYLAACVLDSLIYRSEEQTISLVVHLFLRSLVDLTRLNPCPLSPIDNWLEQLRGSSDHKIRLVAAVQEADPPHKSGHIVSRIMKRKLRINPAWIVKPSELRTVVNNGASVIVFIDDFLGTGQQFNDLIESENLHWLFKDGVYTVYAPFVAHEEGIQALGKKYPKLHVVATEILGHGNAFFKKGTHFFNDNENTTLAAETFYLELLSKKGILLPPNQCFGYGGLGLTYVFSHAVPDNNLPLLWHPSNSNWEPLFSR